ncbi:MAG TPA: hypothetical protein VGR62_21625 [Candidatus Binatia bacterium]|jgi:hypothetical protein|nr:hypothetical protein [Candidatus Binatia bacterium]
MSRVVALLVALLLCPVTPARAFFHVAEINEVMSGVGGDPAVQYVEIRLKAGGQNMVADSRLTVFDCEGTGHDVMLLVPSDVPNSANNARWIMATTTPLGGITPDFTFTGDIPTPCGQVCWGAPGISPPNPASWDTGDPNNYVDCIAYGGYTGPKKTNGTTTALTPGDGSLSLTRNGSGVPELACPTPQNNAAMATIGNFDACTAPTSTTVVTATTTTTTVTTLPFVGQPVAGKKLVLKDSTKPAKRTLIMLGKDTTIDLGGGNGGSDDPSLAGGSVRVASTVAGFDSVYALPASGWKRVGNGKGYNYKDKTLAAGPVKVAVVRNGKLVKLVAKGSALGHTLATNPNPVSVVLSIGGKGYCLTFGGTAKFTAAKRYSATRAPAGTCPP